MAFKHTQEEARKLCIEALRSGEFKQCTGALCQITPKGKTYCCLGVFSEVFSRHEWPLTMVVSDVLNPTYVHIDNCTVSAPRAVQMWLGLRDGDGMLDGIDDRFDMRCLAERNDTGHTFHQIADLMEQEPARVFTNQIA